MHKKAGVARCGRPVLARFFACGFAGGSLVPPGFIHSCGEGVKCPLLLSCCEVGIMRRFPLFYKHFVLK
jgi:hypothetical protein